MLPSKLVHSTFCQFRYQDNGYGMLHVIADGEETTISDLPFVTES